MARKAYIGVGKQVPIYGQVEKEVEFSYENKDYVLDVIDGNGFLGSDIGGISLRISGESPITGDIYSFEVEFKENVQNVSGASRSGEMSVSVYLNGVKIPYTSDSSGYPYKIGDVKKGDKVKLDVFTLSEKPPLSFSSSLTLKGDPFTAMVEDIVGYEEQGIARLVKSAYVGVNTEIPILEKTEQPIPFNTANINKYFDVSNGSGTLGWEYSDAQDGDGVMFKPKNFGINNTTASIVLTLKENLTNFKIVRYNIVTEACCDKFTINSNGTKVIDAIAGNKTGSNITLTGSGSGNTLNLVYVKDHSQHATGETRSYFVISADPITEIVETVVGHEMKEVARKIKKAYIGIGGVARPCFGHDPIEYYGEITPLSTGTHRFGGASSINRAIFAGGYNKALLNGVNAYDSSLVRTLPSALSESRYDLSSADFLYKAVFAGGKDSEYPCGLNRIDVYDDALNRTSPNTLSTPRSKTSAATVGNYVLFAGGETDAIIGNTHYTVGTSTVDAYNSSFSRTIPDKLNFEKNDLGGTQNRKYAIFSGGQRWLDKSTQMVGDVETYNNSLTRMITSPLKFDKRMHGAASIGEYACFFGGGKVNATDYTFEAYNDSLTKTYAENLTVAYLSVFDPKPIVLENFIIILDTTIGVADVYDNLLTKQQRLNILNVQSQDASAKIDKYGLFAGGIDDNNDSNNGVVAVKLNVE